MPNTPVQLPNIDLPGAEFLSLGPNATIALGGRRRRGMQTTTINIPVNTGLSFHLQITLEPQFPHGAGLYVHDTWLFLGLTDSSGLISVQGANYGLSMATAPPNSATYQFGDAAALFTSTPQGNTILMRDRDKLITSDDLTQLAGITQFGVSGTPPPLFFQFEVTLNNTDGAAAHGANVYGLIVYTRLDGILE